MNGFIHALMAPGPAADRADAMDTYGWLVGDWVFDARVVLDGRATPVEGGRIHAAWVLEGRAIQDVWILPGVFAGTTLRVYDPGLDAWHILWSDPLRQYYNRQLGRRHGDAIVQEGNDASGTGTRWSFLDRAPDRFRWLGERRGEDGIWQPVAEFAVRRTPSTTPQGADR
ncbi:hypothetical protein [Fulvimonas yonginensis]|uniref:DUF1579 domain-containing protein n=1 Tax=Fulvimonas yonginensis TaxID=1495200 RepID=A0ABU8JEF5_9GAMM